jgi:hypothetical protein
MPYAVKNYAAILNSWKEIASYLDRGVRTVQRWERELRLPVHRIGKGKRSPVYALVPELNFWLTSVGPEPLRDRAVLRRPRDKRREKLSIVHKSRDLVARSRELVRTVAESSARQQKQTEILRSRLLNITSRLR